MNAQTPLAAATPTPHPAPAQVEPLNAGRLSALVDAELPLDEWDVLLHDLEASPEGLASWASYQLIGEVLRSGGAAAPAPTVDFLQAVHAGIALDPLASTVLPLKTKPLPVRRGEVKRPTAAANDSLFRWKLISGLASVAAVIAVAVNLSGLSGPSVGVGASDLAQAPSEVPVASLPAAVVSAGVQQAHPGLAVATPQGTLIRDAQLEALLAAHRQYGGVSALQMPAGFVRSATYDASSAR